MKYLKCVICLLVIGCFFMLGGTAYSLPMPGQTAEISYGDYGRADGGGEFLIEIVETKDKYLSFCLEIDEHINFSDTYKIASVEDYAELGGVGFDSTDGISTLGRDYLSIQTKWVFWNYLYGSGIFSRKDATIDNDVLANAVQRVIWFNENEITTELAGTALALYDHVYSITDFTGIGTVKVLNIEFGDGDTRFRQSQIIA